MPVGAVLQIYINLRRFERKNSSRGREFCDRQMTNLENYIGGELVKPASGNYIDNFNPATGEVYSLIPDSDDRDVHLAAEAAKAAFPSWSATSRRSSIRDPDASRVVDRARCWRISPWRRASTTESRSRLPVRLTFRVPPRISGFTRRRRCTRANESHETARAGDQLHASPAARRGRLHLARGTCRSIFSPGRSHPAIAAGCTRRGETERGHADDRVPAFEAVH